MAQALYQELGVSIPQLDIVGSGRTSFEPDGVADDERRSLRFGLADSTRCAATPIAPVQEFMRQLVRERRKLVRRRLPGQQFDMTAARGTARGRYLGRVFDGDSLSIREAMESFPIAGLDRLARFRCAAVPGPPSG